MNQTPTPIPDRSDAGHHHPRPLWAIVPTYSPGAVTVALALVPPDRVIIVHGPGAELPLRTHAILMQSDRGTLPAVMLGLLHLELQCEDATAVILGPGLLDSHELHGSIHHAVGAIRLRPNRIATVGAWVVLGCDQVLRDKLRDTTPDLWWPLWRARGEPEHQQEILQLNAPIDVDWPAMLA